MGAALAGYIFCAKKNLDYGQRLVSDLDDVAMQLQPAADPEAPANHPLWVLSHLNAYLPIILAVLAGEAFEDPKGHRFGMNSTPTSAPDEYASKVELVEAFVAGHEAVIATLESSDDDVLATPVTLERWIPVMPTAGICLPYLLCNHENMHLGQISAWRRIQGMPSV